MNYTGRDLNLSSKQLQSWTKSVKNLALSYPQDTHYTFASSLNSPSLGAKMIQPGFNIILGRKGEFFAVWLQRAVFLIYLVTYIFVEAPCIILLSVRIGVRARGARGAAAPPNFGQLIFFGQQEKIWAKPAFKDVFMFFY